MQINATTNPVVRSYVNMTHSWAKRNESWMDNLRAGTMGEAIFWDLTTPLLFISIILWWLWYLPTYPAIWGLDKLW